MQIYRILIILILIFCPVCFIASAEEISEDITASVIVSSTFEVSADSVPIDFGIVKPGETVELYPDRYFNEVRCISNNGRPWYLKSFCENLQGPKDDISSSHLKFRIFWTDGTGYHTTDWTSFGESPVLAYTSGGIDSMGKKVKIQFVYKLEPPTGIAAGNYSAIVTYTMTESP